MEQIDSTNVMPKQEGAHCPSCGRFVGPYRACPYCGAQMKERISTRVMKIFSLAFAIIGVLAIWWATSNRMVPIIQAGEIDNTTNFAYAQMVGVCTRAYTYDAKGKSLSFPLDDGTGTVWIKAYGAQAEEIYGSGNLPKPGDSVSIEGTVRMKGDYQYIIVNLPEKLTITEPEPIEMDISEINDSLWGVVVRSAGIINSVRKYETSMLLQLCSPLADVCLDINVYYSSFPNLNADEYERGDTLALNGMVSSYKSKLQLSPRSEDEWWHKKGTKSTRIWTSGTKPPEDAKQVRLKDLSKDMVGQYAKVTGTVKMAKQIKGGVLVQMDDGTEIVTFPIWDRILETVPNKDDLQSGATISFTGKVDEYKGKMQVIPAYGPDVIVKKGKTTYTSSSSSQKASDAKQLKISELTKDMSGQQATVGGEIKWTKEIKGGILVGINDGTGEMSFPIWDKQLKYVPDRNAIKKGNEITFTGKVGEYKGKMQVIPSRGENIKTTEGSTSTSQPQQAASSVETQSDAPLKIQLVELNDNLKNQTVTIEGEVTKVKEVRGGIIVTIKQGDEYMSTPLWEKAVKGFDLKQISKGKNLTITGKVQEYKGSLQVVPQKADNIIVK